jgi:site-specific DNA-methyltransferase (adenine-specific)
MSEGKKEILLGDCLELMKDIPNGSIDMILCDLPYGTTACKWDTIIPFDKLWEQYERIIKPNGAIVLTASQPFTSALVMSNPKIFKYDFSWDKKKLSGILNAKKQPLRRHEDILVFYKSLPTYNPQMRYDGKKTGIKYHIVDSENYKKTEIVNKYADDGSRYPTSIIDNINGVIGNSKEKLPHPTQKPIALFEYLIKTYTNENDLVLDNTAGSGTTAIACLNTKRQFIVMEKEQKYYDIILKRVGDFNKKFETQTLFGNEM